MKTELRGYFALAALALVLLGAERTMANPQTYHLPVESAALKKEPGNGFATTSAMCAACHSVDYITSQPRGKGKDFWTTEVDKMMRVYGAPIQQPDRDPIIDYLARNY